MKTSILRTATASLLLLVHTCLAQYNQVATNVYAPGAGTNFVDFNARSAPNDLVTFSNDVYLAHGEDLGGDLYFSATMAAGTTSFRVTYGVNNTKRLTITADRPMQAFGPPGGTFWTVSGVSATSTNGFGLANNTDQAEYNLALGPITDVGTGVELTSDKIRKLGFVVCSRTHATYPIDIQATVSYSDGTTESATATIAAPRTYGDTFFGFTAPAGQGITNLYLQAFDDGTTIPVSTRIGIDDIGFVTESPLPPAPTISALTPVNGAVHWASNGLSFQVASQAPLSASGITLLLNSNNVSSQLVVTGDPTNRTVSYHGLVANTIYKLQIAVTNSAGGFTGARSHFYTPESSQVTVFDTEGFTNDTFYPLGFLTSITNGDSYWMPATEPAEIVDLGDGVHGKVLRRQQTGADYTDYAMFSLISSGTVHVRWEARVSSMDGRTIDLSLNNETRGSQGPFLMWGTNALNYYNRTAWVPITTLDADWHSFEMIAYVSGPLAGTFDMKVDNSYVSKGLLWRTVFSNVGSLRIGAIRGAIVQYGEVDNLVIKVAPEPLVALPVNLVNPVHAGTSFSFEFQSLAGIAYAAQYRTNLVTGEWTALGTFQGDGSLKKVIHSNPPVGPVFYRIESTLP